MTERNRVTPYGDIEAFPMRGAWTGNRGVLHEGHDIVRYHAGMLWLVCALEFRGRWRPQWLPRRYTHLYFHDEAVAFAAGHRPCAECRRGSYDEYRAAWSRAADCLPPSAHELDRRLHSERLVPHTHRRTLHRLPWAGLPDGAFVELDGAPLLVLGDRLVEWTQTGYGAARTRPSSGSAAVITPPSTVAVLREGYPVHIDDAAREQRGTDAQDAGQRSGQRRV